MSDTEKGPPEGRRDFEIISLDRDDLLRLFTQEQVDLFSDEDLERVARLLGERYIQNGFWTDLQNIGVSWIRQKMYYVRKEAQS